MTGSFDPLVAEWASFTKNPNFNLAEKCLKLAQLLEYPDLDVDGYVQKMGRMGMSLKESVGGVKNPTYLISMLNEHLYENLGFSGDGEDYYNPKNSFLNDVIDRKAGLPITLAVLYAEVAKFVGLDIQLVGFPGHVLAKHGEGTILDPYHDGRLLGAKELQAMLDARYGPGAELRPEFLDGMSQLQVLTRMARNLKNAWAQSFVYDKALRCTDMILAADPGSPEDTRDKGILEHRMANYDTALEYLGRYIGQNPNAEDVDFVLELIRSTRASL